MAYRKRNIRKKAKPGVRKVNNSNGLTDRFNESRYKRIIILLAIVAGIMLFAGGNYGLIRMVQLSRNLDRINKEIDQLRIKNVDLRMERELLLSDISYRKLIAAEKYGMISRGVVLCRLVD